LSLKILKKEWMLFMLKDFSKEVFDVVIQAGQSNAEGYGLGDAVTPFEPEERVWSMHGDFTVSLAREQVSGNNISGNFALSFAGEYIKSGRLAEGRKLLILLSAVGGTGFSDGRWGLGDDLFMRMLEMTRTALALNPRNRAIALLWHQGETDAINRMAGNVYQQNLSALVGAARNLFRRDLPFVAGDFAQQWKSQNMELCEPVLSALREFCQKDRHAEFVETTGLQSNDERIGGGDTIHFCREALYQLGRRYFEAYAAITLKPAK
jgi:hypothetical protein